MNYITYIMKIRGLSVEDLCVEKYDIFKNLTAEIFLVHSRKFQRIKLEFCHLCFFFGAGNPLVISHDDTNVIIFKQTEGKTYFS